MHKWTTEDYNTFIRKSINYLISDIRVPGTILLHWTEYFTNTSMPWFQIFFVLHKILMKHIETKDFSFICRLSRNGKGISIHGFLDRYLSHQFSHVDSGIDKVNDIIVEIKCIYKIRIIIEFRSVLFASK